MAESRPAPSTRPSDRRASILATAAKQFHARGYHRVSLDDIASAVTISAPALYRHFGGKGALLQAVIDDSLRAIESVVAASSSTEQLAAALAQLSARDDYFGVLLTREVECLDADARDRFAVRYEQIVASVAALIAEERRALDPDITTMLARTALAIPLAAANNPSAAGTEALRHLTQNSVRFVCAELLFDPSDVAPVAKQVSPGDLGQPWLSRSEAILAAAPWLLSRSRGFETVTLEDIGAAVGLSGTGVYRYFSSKAEVFLAVAERSIKWSTVDIERALAMSTSGPDAMFRALEATVRLAHWFAGVFLEPDPLNLSDAQRAQLAKNLDGYLRLWLQCVRAARNDLGVMEQGIMLTMCASVANELATRPGVSASRPDDRAIARASLQILLAVEHAS